MKFVPNAILESDQSTSGLLNAILARPKAKIMVGVRSEHDVFYMEYPRAKMIRNLQEFVDTFWGFVISSDSSGECSILIG